MRHTLQVLGIVLGLAAAHPAAAQVVIVNSSFEFDQVPASPGYGPITGWTSSNASFSGINTQGGAFYNNGATPSGAKVGFLQATPGNNSSESLSQMLTGFTIGHQYTLTFYDNARLQELAITPPPTYPSVTVSLGGVTISGPTVVTPVDPPNVYNLPFHFVTSSTYTATSKTALLTFLATVPTGDGTLLLDNIQIQDITPASAPEPSQSAAFCVGLFGLGALSLRARRRTASS